MALPNIASADPIKMYWGNIDGDVYKANPDGTSIELIIQNIPGVVYGLDVDSKNKKLYIAASSDVYRSNLDGSNLENLSTGLLDASDGPINKLISDNFSDVAVDMKAGHLYYSTNGGLIARTDLDGSNHVEIVSLPNVTISIPIDYAAISAIDLDLKNNKIYWADENRGRVQRCNLDGTAIEDVIPEDASSKRGIAFDSYNNEVYFSDANLGEINKLIFSNNQANRLIQGLGQAYHIDVDVLGGKMYYTDNSASSVFKANLDGSAAEGITGGQGMLTGIALEITPDLDFDRVPETEDSCDLDPLKISLGICGCGVADLDVNSNQVIDCLAEEQPMDESFKVLSALRETNFKNGVADELLASYRALVASVNAANLKGYKKDLNRLHRIIIRLNFLKNQKNNQEEFKNILAKAFKQIKKIRKSLAESSQA